MNLETEPAGEPVRTSSLPVRYVVFRYSHHSPHSGYSRTAEYGTRAFGGKPIVVDKPLPRSIIRERMLWRAARDVPGYTRSAMAAELSVAWHILRERGFIYHFLYGETTYQYAAFLGDVRQNRLVASFHLPPEGIRRSVLTDWHLRRLAAIVCLGRNQQAYFSEIVSPERVFFVPLGVDTEYYTPPDAFEKRDKDLCLVVGENYRDFPTLRGVIELVSYQRPTTKFVAVMPPRCRDLLGEHPNLSFLSGIPEVELLALYRSATLSVLPLLDAVANNAVLESIACGLPMVVSDVGATRDYIDADSAAVVPPRDARCMAETVMGLLDNDGKRKLMAERARATALEFAWPKVVQQLRSVYGLASMGGRSPGPYQVDAQGRGSLHG